MLWAAHNTRNVRYSAQTYRNGERLKHESCSGRDAADGHRAYRNACPRRRLLRGTADRRRAEFDVKRWAYGKIHTKKRARTKGEVSCGFRAQGRCGDAGAGRDIPCVRRRRIRGGGADGRRTVSALPRIFGGGRRGHGAHQDGGTEARRRSRALREAVSFRKDVRGGETRRLR